MNASTTSMQEALLKSEIALPPLNKRLWLYLKDNPRTPVSKLVPVFKTSDDIIRINLTNMLKRGMLEVVKEPRMVKGGYSGTISRFILLYSVPSRMKEYELLPPPKSSAQAKKQATVKAMIQSTPAPLTNQTHVAATSAPKDLQQPAPRCAESVDNMTLREARQLYDELHKLFGARA